MNDIERFLRQAEREMEIENAFRDEINGFWETFENERDFEEREKYFRGDLD